jgi:hypothetical protein
VIFIPKIKKCLEINEIWTKWGRKGKEKGPMGLFDIVQC